MVLRVVSAVVLVAISVAALGQSQWGGRRRSRPDTARIERGDVPVWPRDERFPRDTFTFARVRYASSRPERTSFAWWTDYPDADLNLSYRLHQLTSLKINPDPAVVELTDPKLGDYPWLMMSGVGNLRFTEVEVRALRGYLLRGGFLMVDDFWGQAEWDNIHAAMKEVFPDREPVDLPRTHPLFRCVYDLSDGRSLQTPNIGSAIANRSTGVTWEDNHVGGNTREPHFRALFDDVGRMMVILCHNTDNGDGWEEESGDPWFFSTFSANRNYPLGINILVYAMTH